MISIITSIHNQLDVNRLFYAQLIKCTSVPFELIVIDNNSTDGSREFFSGKANHIIHNTENYSYPHSQNQGIQLAQHHLLAFFNNDLLVSPGWDKKIIGIMETKKIDVISFATNDHLENKREQKKLNRKWKRVKYPLRYLFGTGIRSLKWMVNLTYGNFEQFCEMRWRTFKDAVIEGFSGSCILMKRSVFEKVGYWDEQMQAADFDLFFRVKERAIMNKDVKPVQLALGVYFHHFQRLTLRTKNLQPFADQQNLKDLKEKWGDRMDTLYQDVEG